MYPSTKCLTLDTQLQIVERHHILGELKVEIQSWYFESVLTALCINN
jgi:hypothetical protein